jgi:hypothetical protein
VEVFDDQRPARLFYCGSNELQVGDVLANRSFLRRCLVLAGNLSCAGHLCNELDACLACGGGATLDCVLGGLLELQRNLQTR